MPGVIAADHAFSANDESSNVWNVPVSSEYMLYVVGDLGGGKMSFEASPDQGVNWFTVDTVTGNQGGRYIRYLVSGEKFRMTVCDATLPVACTAGIRQ